MGREMAELFFDKLMGMLGVDTTPQEDQRDPLDTSDPQFGYRDYTPAERAQEVVTGSLDTAGSMLRGMGKAAIEAPRDIYALGSAIGKIQDRSRNRPDVGPVKTIGQLFTEAYREAPSFLPDEAAAERILPEMTPMSRTYSQDASVYNLPEEFGRIAAPLPLLDYARPSQVARLGKAAKPTPRILDARNPVTGRTGFTSGGSQQVPALEPLREPTMAARYSGNDYDQAAEMYRKDTMSYDDLLAEANNSVFAENLRARAIRTVNDNLPEDTDVEALIASGRMEQLINDKIVQFMRGSNAMGVRRGAEPPSSSLLGRPDPTPRILQEDVPKVEKLPPMLREPAQQARVFNEEGGTGTYSRVEQALLDLKNDPNVPASVTPRSLMQRLEAMGVTKADIEEHGLNLDSITRKNKHGHDVVDIQKVFDEVEPPQDRMSRVILGEGGDAEEMNLSQRDLAPMDYYESVGGDTSDEVYNATSNVAYDLGRNDFSGYSTEVAISEIEQSIKNNYPNISDVDARQQAQDVLQMAYRDGGNDWLSSLEDTHPQAADKIGQSYIDDAIERYNENPYIDDTIEFAGEDFNISGNEDIGYSVHHNGSRIIDSVYSLDELEVQIQNWSMDQGYFGYGGEGGMQWAQYLQGDSDYYTPLEEVILTYDPKSGRTFHSSHYGDDVADGYVSHMRTTSRETADGESVYHVDEIQSDLHQEGRQGGYSTAENRNELLQANTDYDAAQASADRVYVELRDDVSIPKIDEIGLKLSPNRQYRVFNMLREGRITPEEFDQKVQLIVLDEITDATDPVKLLRDEGINDPELMRYAEAIEAKRDAYSNVRRLERLGSAPSNEYPLKDERWIKAMVRQAMERAVSKGDFAGITFSNPQNQINQWSNRYAKLYNEVYENKLKSILETIGKEYGVKPKKVKLNDPEMQDAGENWYLPLTPEMTKSIQSRGVPLASAVGTTPMILDRMNKEREDKTPRILRTA